MPLTLSQRLHAEDLFDSLKPEDEKPRDRNFEVNLNKGLQAIIKGFFTALKPNTESDVYIICQKSIPKDYSAKDIHNFSIIFPSLNQDRGGYYGLYLSALINFSKEKEFILDFTHYKNDFVFLMDLLGFHNTKTIVINGNYGSNLGYRMTGGEIIINGNTGRWPGSEIRGGRVIVNGIAGADVGRSMTGGRIDLNGDYHNISKDIRGGDIYHIGKPIILNGQPISGAKIKWKE